ncbi:dual oxidase maturation factor 1-like [Amphiura filiformis]|uniref:dual oxidase maturation factor 1-like n=1 Tax=Amphiura filiformis TaxID=82378 RepID=UPI003B2223DC
MVYDAFRDKPYPARYPPLKTAVRVDVTYSGIIFAIAILAFSFLVVIPGVRTAKKRLFALTRIFLSLLICACILLSIHGQEWEVASIHNVTTAYKAFVHQEIHADIGVNIGLKNVNITLRTNPYRQEHGELEGERIDYNERFNFDDGQGLNGFGRFAGRIQREFRAAQWKGLPYPILWIAEYFTLDGEGIRWGRYYRWGGFYTLIVLWFSFPLFLLSTILQFMVIRYAGIFSCMTGISMLAGNVIYAAMKYLGAEMKIPFGAEPHEILSFSKGGSFILCLVGGLVALIYGAAMLLCDEFFPNKTADFFNIDPLIDYQDTYVADTSGAGGSVQNGDPVNVNLKPEYRKSRAPLFHKRNERKTVRSGGVRHSTASMVPEDADEHSQAIELQSQDHDIRFQNASRGLKTTPSARDSVAINDDIDISQGAYVNKAAMKMDDDE